MFVKEEFLSRVGKIFDLNLYETKLWLSLLSREISTAGELSRIGDVPRSRTYDVLESLERKGFITMKLGKPIKFIAIKPEEVVESVKRNLIINAKQKTNSLDKLKEEEVMKELENLYEQGSKFIELSDLSGNLLGRKNIHHHLNMLIRNAEKTITLATTESGLNRKLEALLPAIEKAKNRGVKIKISAPITTKNKAIAKEFSKFADVKNIANPGKRFAIIDSEHVLCMLLNDTKVHPNYDLAIWVNTPFFAQALEKMFGVEWKN